MYAEFLSTLGAIALKLDEIAKMGSDGPGMPTPYVAGRLEVRLEGEPVGYFEFQDEFVTYHDKPEVKS